MSGKCKIYWGLWPFSALYGIGVKVRNLLFDVGWLREERFPLPVICIGNLTVGGTGKTPHTEYFIRLLQDSFRLAVLSRGYKRKSKGFVLASSTSRMEDIGDEPYQMAHKFPSIHVAVDGDRCRGIRQLISLQGAPDTEVILLDDAFQHRYVRPGLRILLMDYHRPVECDQLLPAGRSGTCQRKETSRFAHRHEMPAYPQSGGMRTYPPTYTSSPASGSVFHYPGLRKVVSFIYGCSCPTAGCVKR